MSCVCPKNKHDAEFARAPDSDDLLRPVNTQDLPYAPAVSSDGLELFFARVHEIRADALPRIWHIVRRQYIRTDARSTDV